MRVCAWAVEIDGDKPIAAQRIKRAPLKPSRLIESKNGYHVWWHALDGTAANYGAIVERRLLPFFGADPAAKDLARVLRTPGFNHLKNPAEPFLIRELDRRQVAYTEQQMMEAFPDLAAARARLRPKPKPQPPRLTLVPPGATGDFWQRAQALDCEAALTRLSGHSAVGGERYTFAPASRGTLTIIVDGKPTSCWIDRDGKIGSTSKGGPGVAQWLHWFGHSYSEIKKTLLDVFPELEQVR